MKLPVLLNKTQSVKLSRFFTQGINSSICQDKSLLEAGLVGVSNLVMEEWGSASSLNLNLIIVTDGALGHGPQSLSHLANVGPSELKLPLQFPCTVSVVFLADKVNFSSSNYNCSCHLY